MPATLLNVARAALHPRRLAVMSKKALRRVADEKGRLTAAENNVWLDRHAVDFEPLARSLDAPLFEEACRFAGGLRERAAGVLAQLGVRLGGSGYVELLYFVTRLRRPEHVVETGVAAGFSSQAILAALALNGRGRLDSSDFPYFRLPHPERFIGVLVDEQFRSNWRLHLDGDEANLPRILAETPRIDLFHYDSDKSYTGRRRAMELIEPHCHAETLIVMDDLQDGSFFRDYVTERAIRQYSVLRCGAKFVGMIGRLAPGPCGREPASPA